MLVKKKHRWSVAGQLRRRKVPNAGETAKYGPLKRSLDQKGDSHSARALPGGTAREALKIIIRHDEEEGAQKKKTRRVGQKSDTRGPRRNRLCGDSEADGGNKPDDGEGETAVLKDKNTKSHQRWYVTGQQKESEKSTKEKRVNNGQDACDC